MNPEVTAAPLTEEAGNVIAFPSRSIPEILRIPNIGTPSATYVPSTDLEKVRPRQWLGGRYSEGKSFGALDPRERVVLDLAFSRISQTVQTDFTMAEISNSFDEWKDLLETASRKLESFTNNHRKILGTLLSILGGKDISDFGTETLRIFRDATNLMRMPRTSKQDARRIITELLKQGKRTMMPLGVDESAKEEVEVLDNMIGELILKSRKDP